MSTHIAIRVYRPSAWWAPAANWLVGLVGALVQAEALVADRMLEAQNANVPARWKKLTIYRFREDAENRMLLLELECREAIGKAQAWLKARL